MSHVINPCPTCGKRFDFQLTGCMSFVDEWLTTSTGGICPACGTIVVVAEPPPNHVIQSPLDRAQTSAEKRAVPVVDWPLSIRCRAWVNKMGIKTIGDLLDQDPEKLRLQLAGSPGYFEQIEEMLSDHGLQWNSAN